jgi:cell division septation protein DedD
VLRAEELDFYDALNRKPGEAAAPAAKVAPAPKGPAPAAPAAAAAATTTAKPQAPAATAPAQAAPAPVAPAMQDAPGQRFAYVYQAAALRDAADARQFAARLQAKGLTTSIETVQAQGATWHRVLVHFQGTPSRPGRSRTPWPGSGSRSRS